METHRGKDGSGAGERKKIKCPLQARWLERFTATPLQGCCVAGKGELNIQQAVSTVEGHDKGIVCYSVSLPMQEIWGHELNTSNECIKRCHDGKA